MLREGFRDFVVKIWSTQYEGNIIDQWQQRMKESRQKVRGCILNSDAWYIGIEN